MARKTELAWAAGFFDGEGSIFIHKSWNRNKTKYYPYLTLQVSNNDEQVVLRWDEIIGGVGKHYSGIHNKGKKIHYQCRVWDQKQVARIMKELAPYLSEYKRNQYARYKKEAGGVCGS